MVSSEATIHWYLEEHA